MELNAEQIKKALGCCHSHQHKNCPECPYNKDTEKACFMLLMEHSLSLITSQEQRIKELTQANEQLSESYDHLEKTKDELLAERSRLIEKCQEAEKINKEKCNLEYTLLGVMHSVDKWLDGEELEQDEVNRAITMRDKTLRLCEELDCMIDNLRDDISELTEENERLRAEKDAAVEDLKHCMYFAKPKRQNTCNFCAHDCEVSKNGTQCKGKDNWIYCSPVWRGVVKAKAEGE